MKVTPILLLLVIQLFTISCFPHTISKDEIIARCCDEMIETGFIVIPEDKDKHSFIIIDNEIMHDRVYYDNYYSDYSSYRDFLNSAIESPGIINYCSSIGLCDSYLYGYSKELLFRWNFKLFAHRYLKVVTQGVYTLLEEQMDKWPYILSYCFSLGYYLYFSDYQAEWIISKDPYVFPYHLVK